MKSLKEQIKNVDLPKVLGSGIVLGFIGSTLYLMTYFVAYVTA